MASPEFGSQQGILEWSSYLVRNFGILATVLFGVFGRIYPEATLSAVAAIAGHVTGKYFENNRKKQQFAFVS